ncbi:hypothetical protein LUZ63_018823 [Rhynchospora breviuscula]|uniref:GRF-type domain-containing protein n=1 Tax=Rhynchospora breviuscula TaxID=2022672 RepID=A0A9Q0HIV6_9POAL|nr:hypothetical protein LUZ63_018823 [Rhynchospora breviuscula]
MMDLSGLELKSSDIARSEYEFQFLFGSGLFFYSSSVGPQPEGLILVPCPDCGVTVKRLVSRTDSNPNRVFYKCPNKNTRCKFWMWDDAYEGYAKAYANDVTYLNSELLTTLAILEAQLEKLTDKFKKKCEYDDKQIKALALSLDKISLHIAISAFVIVMILIVLIACFFNCNRVGRIHK